MRTKLSDVLNVGDRVTVTEGVYAGVEGHVLELLAVSPCIGRARPCCPAVPITGTRSGSNR